MTHAPGRQFVLVVSILFIIFGGIGVLGAFSGLGTASLWNVIMPVSLPWGVYYGFVLIAAGFRVFAGIMGVMNANNPEKASFLRLLGAVAAGLVVVDALIALILFPGALGGITAVFGLIFGLVLPVLFIIGAQKNMQA